MQCDDAVLLLMYTLTVAEVGSVNRFSIFPEWLLAGDALFG
jgi:hypothetical protein